MYMQERNGRFRFFERYQDPVTGKTRTVSVTMEKNTTHSRNMAKSILRQKVRHATDEPVPAGRLTLQHIADAYIDDIRDNSTVENLTRSKSAVKSVVKILGPETLYLALTPLFIQRRLRNTGKTPTRLNGYLRTLKAMSRWAYRNDIVQDIDSVEKVKLFKEPPHRVKIEDKYLETQELAVLLENMPLAHWNLVTQFLALSGLRFGEFSALEKSDVDFTNHVIHVTKSFDCTNHVLGSTKTSSSIRDVYMQPELEDVCRQIRRLMKRQKIQTTLFMWTIHGQHMDYKPYNRYMGRISEEVLGKRITAHALRHTHASILFEQGFTMDEIARRLGHSKSEITREIYVHITEKLRERDAEKLSHVRILS